MLYVVGLGPGPSDLITVKASKLLSEAHVIFLLAKPTTWMYQSVRQFGPQAQVELYYPQSVKWAEMEGDAIHEQVVTKIQHLLDSDKRVVWACAGDPSFFSPFAYLQPYLQARKVSFEVVPSVGFINAIGAVAQQPLAIEREGLLVTKLRSKDACNDYFKVADNLVLFDPKPEEVEAVCSYAREAGLQHVSFTQINSDFSRSHTTDLLLSQFPGGVGLLLARRQRI